MAVKTYRYRLEPDLDALERVAGVKPTIATPSAATIELTYDDAYKTDVDEAMCVDGWAFDQEMP